MTTTRVVGRTGTAPDAPVVAVTCEDGVIASVDELAAPRPGDATRVLRPGLVDLQVNGVGTVDLTTDPGGIWEVGAALAAEGVTAFLPTLVSPSRMRVDEAVAVLRAGAPAGWVGARPLGWHVEGPHLAPGRRGAHPPDALRDVLPDEAATWARPDVRVVTLAPERAGALGLVAGLAGRGVVVALGHTDTDVATARAAVDAGARLVTHWPNAMAPLHHRAPGLAGLALVDDRLWVGVIADGHHVGDVALALAHRAAGERVVLVSDRVAAGADGAGSLAGHPVRVADGAARHPEGQLAGAVAGLGVGVGGWARATGTTADDAWAAASTRPAAVLGIAQAAGVVVGAPADLVVLEEDGTVSATVVGGVVVHAA